MEQLRPSLLPIADSGPIGAAYAGETADARYLVDCIVDADRFDAFRRPLMELSSQALEPALAAEFAWTKAALVIAAERIENTAQGLIRLTPN